MVNGKRGEYEVVRGAWRSVALLSFLTPSQAASLTNGENGLHWYTHIELTPRTQTRSRHTQTHRQAHAGISSTRDQAVLKKKRTRDQTPARSRANCGRSMKGPLKSPSHFLLFPFAPLPTFFRSSARRASNTAAIRSASSDLGLRHTTVCSRRPSSSSCVCSST